MKLRRQRGATLGLVAACVFLVILVGVGFFFLSKIIGGGREVANATDAGVLNVAKQAVRRGAVPLTGGLIDEFGELTEPKDSKVDLVTYNRLVAQALIVGKNAETLGGTAIGHANSLRADVRTIGLALKNNLAAEPNFATDFSSIASQNNTKMWDGPAVSLVGAVNTGYMKTGSSTNVYFAKNTLDALGGWTPPLSSQSAKGDPTAKYLAGYTPFNVNGNPTFLYGVPVLPQTKPHLVDHGQFTTAAVDADTPPNAFRTNSRALEGKSGAMGTSVACAIVGVINKEFAAVIPRGFVRIKNGDDAELANGVITSPVSNGNNDIFNNELYPPSSGVYTANYGGSGTGANGGAAVFSTNQSEVTTAQSKWKQYVATLGAHPKGSPMLDGSGNPVLDGLGNPRVNDLTDESGANYGAGDPYLWETLGLASYLKPGTVWGSSTHDLRSTDGLSAPHGQYASYADLIALGKSSGGQNCFYTMYDDTMDNGTSPYLVPCAGNIANWMDNYGRGPSYGATTQPGGFSNVEYMKADLLQKIAGRKGGKFCASAGGYPASGLKAWPTNGAHVEKSGATGSGKPYTGGNNINFMNVGTTLTYLKQLNAPGGTGSTTCDANSIIDMMTKRMQQVEPTVTQADVEAALGDNNFPLTLNGAAAAKGGSKLYLYVDPGSKKPVVNTTLPWKDVATADGPLPAGANKCESTYPLNGWAVNTEKNVGGASIGDGNYHEVPFTQVNSSPDGTDSALWQPSSGFNNMLGELKFQQTVEGATFCKPN